MTTDISDGNFYLSRARCNRHTVTCELTGPMYMGRINLNGKVTQIVVDYSGILPLDSGSGKGMFTMMSDVTTTGGSQIPYHTPIENFGLGGLGFKVLDVTPGSDVQDRGVYPAFQNTSGDNLGGTELSTEGGSVAIGKTSWNGLVTGDITFLFALVGSSPVGADGGNVKITIYTE